jgi:hypothetical protein
MPLSVREILLTHPTGPAGDLDSLVRCIEECLACAQACTADLAEDDVVEMRRCIRLCLDCADVCDATWRVATRLTDGRSPSLKKVLEACLDTCRHSRKECERHAPHHEHCRICAVVCKRCEDACQALIDET